MAGRGAGRGVAPSRSRQLVRDHALGVFFLLACAFSWAYWVPLALLAPGVTHVPGLLGPMLAAVVLTAVEDGGGGLRDLLSRATRWRVPPRWYAVALAPVGAGLLVLGVLAAAGRGWPTAEMLSAMPGAPAGWLGLVAVLLLVNGYGEETGWRGYAWCRLRRRHGLAGAALLLSGPWALWHLPTFWLDTGLGDLDLLAVPGWLIALPFGAVALGWLYERTRHSLVVVTTFHAGVNWASATEGTAGLPAAAVSVLVVVAAVVILRHEHRPGAPGPRGEAASDGLSR